MCGLVGIAGDIGYAHKEAFKQLLIVDQVRGMHGTGAASVGASGDVDWVKRGGDAGQLIDLKTFDRVVSVTRKALIGHNRHATLGAHTSDNAHPFDFKNVIGAHNGTLPINTRRLLKGYTKYDTDSEALYSQINDGINEGKPWQDAVADTIGLLDDGAWALSMYIKTERKLAFLRNKERPFYYTLADEGKILAWASESWMLYSVLGRNGIAIDEQAKVLGLAEDSMIWFDIPKAGDKFHAPGRIKIMGAPKKVVQTHYASSNFTPGSTTKTEHTAAHHTTSTKVLPFPNDNKKGHYKPPYKDYTGKTMNRPEFDRLIVLGNSCTYCNLNVPKWGEECLFLRPTPVGAPQFLCQECIQDEEIFEIAKAMR